MLGGRRREGVKTLQQNEELACNLVLTEETVRWRRYCPIHSVQIKVAVQGLRRFSNGISKEGWKGGKKRVFELGLQAHL